MVQKILNKEKQITLLLLIISVILLLSSIGAFIGLDASMLKGEIVRFTDENNERLVGKYYPGEVSAGIIFLEGFGSDQIALKSVMSEFYTLGVHMFSFDFVGQGRSSGVLGFDNAATDVLAKELLDAKEEFKMLSGLDDSEIIYFGHSMGARVALQATTLDSNNISGLILFGTQISLEPNVQSSFFTGVNDLDVEWIQNLASDNPTTDILLLSGTWDDVLTKSSAFLLYEKLSGQTATNDLNQQVIVAGNLKELYLIRGLFHNYEVYSPRAIAKAKNWAIDNFGLGVSVITTIKATTRITFWFVGLISLFGTILLSGRYLRQSNDQITQLNSEADDTSQTLSIINSKKYLSRKLLLLLAALPIAIILVSLFMLIPIGLPIFNVIYVGIFGGFGILLWILYRLGKMPAIEGNLIIKQRMTSWQFNWKNIAFFSISSIFLITYLILFTRSGFFYIYPLNLRLVWLALFTIFSIPGFYIGNIELELIRMNFKKVGSILTFNTLIILIPFFIQTIFFLILGSTTGFLGGINGLVILAIVILSGDLLMKLSNSPFLTAIVQSLLLQMLVLPQGSLFLIFY